MCLSFSLSTSLSVDAIALNSLLMGASSKPTTHCFGHLVKSRHGDRNCYEKILNALRKHSNLLQFGLLQFYLSLLKPYSEVQSMAARVRRLVTKSRFCK